MKALGPEEGRGSNPYYAGNFKGESDELRDLRLSLVAERGALKAELERIKALEPVAVIGPAFQILWTRQMPLEGLKVGDTLYALGSKT